MIKILMIILLTGCATFNTCKDIHSELEEIKECQKNRMQDRYDRYDRRWYDSYVM